MEKSVSITVPIRRRDPDVAAQSYEQGERKVYLDSELLRAEKAARKRNDGLLSVICPHCSFVNQFPGWQAVFVFFCDSCGQSVRVDESVR